MAHILCMTSGLTGILNASFELANRLEGLGHTVTCASPKDVADLVQAHNLNYLQLPAINFDPAPEVPAYSGPLRKLKRLSHKATRRAERQKQAINNLGMQEFKQLVETLNPDLVIADIELHEHIMTLVTAKYKVLLLSQWFSTWDSKGLPPIQSTIIPGEGFEGSAPGLWLRWQKVRWQRWHTFFKKKLTSVYTDRRTILQLYAKQTGFPGRYILKNYWPGPFSYDQLPVISMTAQDMEFAHKKKPELTYIGPMVSESRLNLGHKADERLERIFGEKKRRGLKLIYCSVSTFSKGDTSFLKKVIAAVSGYDNWLLILSLGGNLKESQLGEVPGNVHVFDRVPQLKVLRETDLSINHGGIHTINECLYFKVPMLVYSGKRSDQNGCAARVHFHGLGLMADKDLDSPDDIRNKIKQVMQDEAVKGRLEALHNTSFADQNQYLSKVLEDMGVGQSHDQKV